jgi:ABC-type antimicrobial peptide transport system permease subunit
VRSTLLRAQQLAVAPTLYLPMWQDPLARMSVLLDTPSTTRAALHRLRAQLAQVPGGRPDKLVVTTLDDHLRATALAPEHIASVLVGTFAMVALLLGVLGLYGIMADSVRRRRREFAVRLALGAQGWRVARQLLSEGLLLVSAGVIAGMAASAVVSRWLGSITPGAGVPSAIVLLAAPLALSAAVAIASIVPARRALSVELPTIMRDA